MFHPSVATIGAVQINLKKKTEWIGDCEYFLYKQNEYATIGWIGRKFETNSINSCWFGRFVYNSNEMIWFIFIVQIETRNLSEWVCSFFLQLNHGEIVFRFHVIHIFSYIFYYVIWITNKTWNSIKIVQIPFFFVPEKKTKQQRILWIGLWRKKIIRFHKSISVDYLSNNSVGETKRKKKKKQKKNILDILL